jgi:signal transduction histidine kinase
MSDAVDQPSDGEALRQQIARLEKRVQRERSARLEAERIAEDGMRSLYLANRDLDQRILERTRQLDEALEVAHTANRAKTAFLAHMSHHLMTPLNGVVGMLELLGDADYEDHQSAWHASALRSARRLDRLVRQLLSFVEVDGVDLRGSAPIRALNEELVAVEARWRQPMLRAGQLPMFDLTSVDDVWIAAPPQLAALFDEVFSNVVEHAGPGPVEVRVRLVDDSTIAVDVTDAGAGIDPATQAMASSLGIRADLEQQEDDSAPLGLVLMHRIAHGLGGRIIIGGSAKSTLTVELPSERPPQSRLADAEPSGAV